MGAGTFATREYTATADESARPADPHEQPTRHYEEGPQRGLYGLERYRRRLRDRPAASVAVFVERQPVAQVVPAAQVEEPAPTPDQEHGLRVVVRLPVALRAFLLECPFSFGSWLEVLRP